MLPCSYARTGSPGHIQQRLGRVVFMSADYPAAQPAATNKFSPNSEAYSTRSISQAAIHIAATLTSLPVDLHDCAHTESV